MGEPAVCVSERKMRVTATRNLVGVSTGGKRWVRVSFASDKGWIPSFRDLHRAIQAISFCEDEKYPGGKGRGMVADFLRDCVFESDWPTLEQRYKIPSRCKSIVKSHP